MHVMEVSGKAGDSVTENATRMINFEEREKATDWQGLGKYFLASPSISPAGFTADSASWF